MVKNNPFVKSVKMYSMLLLREKIHEVEVHVPCSDVKCLSSFSSSAPVPALFSSSSACLQL